MKRLQQWNASSRNPDDDEPRWGASDIIAMILAMFDTIGPGLLAIAGIMIVISMIVTLLIK